MHSCVPSRTLNSDLPMLPANENSETVRLISKSSNKSITTLGPGNQSGIGLRGNEGITISCVFDKTDYTTTIGTSRPAAPNHQAAVNSCVLGVELRQAHHGQACRRIRESPASRRFPKEYRGALRQLDARAREECRRRAAHDPSRSMLFPSPKNQDEPASFG